MATGGINIPPVLHFPRCFFTLRRNALNDKVSNKRPSPFSIRLSDDERSEIVRRADAAGLSIGGYWKSVVLNAPPPRRSRRAPADHAELAKLLAHLGKLSSNVNQLARQINTEGSVDLPELVDALADIAIMRNAIMSALGYRETDSDLNNHDRHQP